MLNWRLKGIKQKWLNSNSVEWDIFFVGTGCNLLNLFFLSLLYIDWKKVYMFINDLFKFSDATIPMDYTAFFTSIIGVDAAILAISIPVAIDVFNRLLDKYTSEYIGELLFNRWKGLPCFFVLNIVISLLLLFLTNILYENFIWKFFTILNGIFFVILLICFLFFTRQLVVYFNRPSLFIDELTEDLDNEIKG